MIPGVILEEEKEESGVRKREHGGYERKKKKKQAFSVEMEEFNYNSSKLFLLSLLENSLLAEL